MPDRAPTITFDWQPIYGTFVRRLNRFSVEVRIDGRLRLAHLRNSGRLRELLRRGAECVLLRPPVRSTRRRSDYTLLMVRVSEGWCCVDATLPTRILAEWLSQGMLKPFDRCRLKATEPKAGPVRLDLLLTDAGNGANWFVEVKSCTLTVGRWALFPDAPTVRGVRHLAALAELQRSGQHAALIWAIMHPAATRFWPNEWTDPRFAKAVQAARRSGVLLAAWKVRTWPTGAQFAGPVPIRPPTARERRDLSKAIERHATE